MTQRTPNPRRPYAVRMAVPERREQLLDAALDVLAETDYQRVSIEAIAQRAGVTRPVVYAAFDDLPDLLVALIDRTQQRAVTSAVHLLPHGEMPDNVDEWLIDAIGGLVDVVHAEPDAWRPILGVLENAHPLVRDRIAQMRGVVLNVVAEGLKLGLDRRGGPSLDIELLSHIVLGTIEQVGRLTLADPEKYNRDRLLSALADLLEGMPPVRR